MFLPRRGRGRIAFALALAAALGLAGAPAPATAETLRVGKATPVSFTFALLDAGIRLGRYKAHGLDVEIVGMSGSGPLFQAMAAGSIDIGLSGGPDLALVARGAPLKCVGVISNQPLSLSLALAPGLRSVEALKGRRIGVVSLTAPTAWLVMQLSRRQGWGPKGIELVTSSQAASWSLLKTRQIDGLAVDLLASLPAEAAGLARVFRPFGDLVTDFHNNALFAADRTIAERPAALRAFLAAWYETAAYLKTHREEAIRLFSDILAIDPVLTATVYDAQFAMYSDTGRFSPAALATLARSFVDLGFFETEPDLAGAYTEAFLPAR